MFAPRVFAAALFVSLTAAPALSAPQKKEVARKPDLADAVASSYFGDVISDSKGSGRSDVTITVTRSGLNEITVASDYPRLPPITVKLSRAMDKILSASGDSNSVRSGEVAAAPRHQLPQRGELVGCASAGVGRHAVADQPPTAAFAAWPT